MTTATETPTAHGAAKALLRSLFEAINAGAFHALAAHDGFHGTRRVVPPMHARFADWRTTHVQQIAEDDLVFTYTAIELTHVRRFAGAEPTGRRVVLDGCSVDRVRDGLVVAHNSTMSWPGVMRQVGVPGFERWPVDAPALLEGDPSSNDAAEARELALAQLYSTMVHDREPGAHLPPALQPLGDEFRAIRAVFPDLDVEWVATVAEGDLLGTRAVLRGTHRGPLHGFAPTGRTIAWDHFGLARVAGGQIVAHRSTVAWTRALALLGLLPGEGA